MRRIWIVVGLLAISCSLAGCEDDAPPPSPEESKQALEFVKKANRGPMVKSPPPGSTEGKK